MFGGASVSLDADERKLVEHLRKQPPWKFTFAYWVAATVAFLATVATVIALWMVLSDWPSTPASGGILAALGALTTISGLLYNRSRWAMAAYRLIRRVDGAGSPPKGPSP